MIFKKTPEVKWAMDLFTETTDELKDALTRFHSTPQPNHSIFFLERPLIKAFENFERALFAITDFRNRNVFDPYPGNMSFVEPRRENDTRDDREIDSMYVQMEPKFLKIDNKYLEILPHIETFFKDIVNLWPEAVFTPFTTHKIGNPLPKNPDFTLTITVMDVELLGAKLVVANSIFQAGIPKVFTHLNNGLRLMAMHYAQTLKFEERNTIERVIDSMYIELEPPQFRSLKENEVYGEIYTFQPKRFTKEGNGTCFGLRIEDKVSLLLTKKMTERTTAFLNSRCERIETLLPLICDHVNVWLENWPPCPDDIGKVRKFISNIHIPSPSGERLSLQTELETATNRLTAEEKCLAECDEIKKHNTETLGKAQFYSKVQICSAYIDAATEESQYHSEIKRLTEIYIKELKTIIDIVNGAERIIANAEEGTIPDELKNKTKLQSQDTIGTADNPAHIVIDPAHSSTSTDSGRHRTKKTIDDAVYQGKKNGYSIEAKLENGKQTFIPKGGKATGKEKYVITNPVAVECLEKLLKGFTEGEGWVKMPENWGCSFGYKGASKFTKRFIEKAKYINRPTQYARINLDKDPTSNFVIVTEPPHN